MIVIIGASKGIGKYLHGKFTSLDLPVIGTYNKTSEETEGLYQVDVTSTESVTAFFESISDKLNEVVLINCAGINYNAFGHKADTDKWKKVIDVNLVGTFNCIHEVLPVMREQNFGRIINFSSVVAGKGTPGISAYSASKSALWGMAKSLTQENAKKNITINNINLGYSELGMIEQVPEEFLNQLISQIPAKKLCEPIDIYLTVKYIMECSYLNGASIDLNGGLH